jgi:hypothetical protein
VAATLVVGCAAATTSEVTVAPDRDVFAECTPALMAAVCGKDGDEAAQASCLQSRRAAFERLRAAKTRRSWLIANGCTESTIDAPPRASTTAALATPPAPAAVVVAMPPAPAAVVVAMPPAPPPPPPGPPPIREPAPTPEPASAPAPAIAAAAAPAPAIPAVPAPTPVAAPPEVPLPAGPGGAFSSRDRVEARGQRLRDIISTHQPEMKSCVDRQLKLVPSLKAEGTLVIDVEKDGTVPSAELQGVDLAGTPLETCLRTAATHWRFPASARPYTISAPVKVLGSGLAR